MGRKNPLLAAILNFLLPGLGFMYCGTTPFIIGGFSLLMLSLAETAIAFSQPLTALTLLLSLVGAFVWAVLGYGAVECINKSVLPPLQPPPSPAPPPSTPRPSEKVYCVYCGAENPVDAAFCKKCGKKIS
jgi:hypothetical protein